VDVEHMTTGTLYPIFGHEALVEAHEQTRFPLAKEMGMRIVEGTELRQMEPRLSREIPAALFVRGDHMSPLSHPEFIGNAIQEHMDAAGIDA
jgi:hypothetical protein